MSSDGSALTATVTPSVAVGLDPSALWFRAFLFGIAALGPFSLNVFSPCLPFIRSELDVSLPTVQLAATLSILAAAAATIFAGPLADLVGRRPVLVLSLAAYVAGGIAAALAPHVAVLVAGRLVQAATSSVAFVTARALIHDVYGEGIAARVIARVSLFTVVAVVLAPLASGFAIESFGWRSVFVLTTGIGAVLLAAVATRVAETRHGARRAPSLAAAWSGSRELLRTPAFHGFALQSALHFAVFFAFTVTASHVMVDVLHEPATGYGVWFVALSIAVGLGLGTADRLAVRVAPAKIAAGGSAVALLGALLSAYFLLHDDLTPARLFLPVAVSAVGIGLAVPATNAGVMAVRPELAATASGWMGFFQYVAAAIFAQAVARDASRTPEALAAVSVIGCGGAALFSLLPIAAAGTAPVARAQP